MNVILLPDSAFDLTGQFANITQKNQLEHLKKVLKTQVGDTLKIGMLNGMIGQGRVSKIDKDKCFLSDVIITTAPPKKLDLTLVLALPRPKVLRRLILDMTAMGVQHIILINSYRTDKSYWHSPLLNRLDEFVMEGLQQAIDTTAPKITLEKYFKPFVEDKLPKLLTNKIALVAHPYAHVNLTQFTKQHGLPQILFVGAEGGFISYEIDLLHQMGVYSASLGNRILRTESAVNALLGRYLD